MAFDPDAFIAGDSNDSKSFDPDAFLSGSKNSSTDTFADEYRANASKGIGSKLLDLASIVPNAAKGIYNVGVGGVQGMAEMAGKASSSPEELLKLPGNIKQTVLEAGARGAYDVANQGRQLLSYLHDKIKEDPLASLKALAQLGVNPTTAISSLLESTLKSKPPSDQEIENARNRDIANQAYAQTREEGVAPKIYGEPNSKVADAGLVFGSLAAPLLQEGALARLGSSVNELGAMGKAGLTAAKDLPGDVGLAALKKIPTNFTARLATRLEKKPEDFAALLTRPSSDAEVMNFERSAADGSINKVLQNIKENGGGNSVYDALNSSEKALSKQGTEINLFKAENPDINISGQDAVQAAKDKLLKNKVFAQRLTPEENQKIDELLKPFNRDLSLGDAFDYQNDLNELQKPYLLKSRMQQATTKLDDIEHKINEGLRQSLSEQLSDQWDKLHPDQENPYRMYGQINNFKTNLEVEGAHSAVKSRIVRAEGAQFDANPRQLLNKNVNLLKGGKLGDMDRAVSKMFRKIPGNTQELPPQLQNQQGSAFDYTPAMLAAEKELLLKQASQNQD